MDPRLNLQKIFGPHADSAYTIRNAGGRASDDALRSLIISHKLLGTEKWFVIHHTDCGMQKFNNEVMGCLLKHSLETAVLIKNCNVTLKPVESVCACKWKDVGKCPGSIVGECIDWLPILDGLKKSVIDDVSTIRNHPLVPEYIPIYGYIYDVAKNELIPVPEAMKIGKATKRQCCVKNHKHKICHCHECKCKSDKPKHLSSSDSSDEKKHKNKHLPSSNTSDDKKKHKKKHEKKHLPSSDTSDENKHEKKHKKKHLPSSDTSDEKKHLPSSDTSSDKKKHLPSSDTSSDKKKHLLSSDSSDDKKKHAHLQSSDSSDTNKHCQCSKCLKRKLSHKHI